MILAFVILLGDEMICLFPVIFIGFVFWVWRGWKTKEKALNEIEQDRIKKEEKRVAMIMSHEDEYGKEMCQWLIWEQVDLEQGRETKIMRKWDEYGEEVCKDLIYQKINPGMTTEMVRLSLGIHHTMDNREVTPHGEKVRWVYGGLSQGKATIWFKDGKVTKVEQ
jgi:hypothetical protein